MGRHGAIGSLVGIIRFIKAMSFRMRLKLLDDPVRILPDYFSVTNASNTGRIKDGHICFRRVNCLADRFGNINKLIKYEL